jgi:ABC-type nitrate/sulfonate/bicarbonate transport system ATPase subunit
MPPENPVIRCESVSYDYRTAGHQTRALDSVDLEIAKGELAVLLGPSGCGKTTLLNLISGFLKPNAGTLRVAGQQVMSPSPERTVVFQDHALFDWMTVEGNIRAGLHSATLDASHKDDRVRELIGLVNLVGSEKKYPYQLSGGMRQRAGLARALAPKPQVILLDEPFASLDALSREKLQDELRAIWAETGTTGVLVTHSIDEAAYLGDIVYVMSVSPGRIAHVWRTNMPRTERSRLTGEFAEATRSLRQQLEDAVDAAV